MAERTIVAITGASSGIGAVFARKLAAEHDLLLVARRQERLEALGAELREIYGTNIEVLSADLAEETALARVAERMRNERRLALLINNAGFGVQAVATSDGSSVIEALMPYQNVTVFYGHIHQENHFTTGNIAHHSANASATLEIAKSATIIATSVCTAVAFTVRPTPAEPPRHRRWTRSETRLR